MQTVFHTADEAAYQLAANLLASGELVAFPTETVYGLGANALNEQAVRQIFAVKGRPANNPLIVHFANADQAAQICRIDERARLVMDRFCPGPITLLLPKLDNVPAVVNAGLPSVAVRIPSHPAAHRMLEVCGLPIAAPSANTSGKPSPTTAQHVLHDMDGKIPLIIDGGPCSVGLESTVIDMTGKVPTIVRPGGVTPEMLLEVLDEVRVADSVMRPLRPGEKAVSPGMMYRHYAPEGNLTLVSGAQPRVQETCIRLYREAEADQKKVCILAFDEHLSAYDGLRVHSIGSLSAPETAARRLFAVLRELDEEKMDVMYSEVLPASGIGLAIMNRLGRAAAFRMLNVDE